MFVLTDGAAVDPTLGRGPTTASTVRVVSPSAATREVSSTCSGTTASPLSPDSGRPASAGPTEPGVTDPDTDVYDANDTADDAEASTGGSRRSVSGERLGAVAGVLGGEVESIERRAGGLESGELRLCVDSLDALFAGHTPGAVKRFVSVVGNRVRAVSGMAHCHLSADRSDPVCRRLEPAFDAVIELRRGPDGEPEHRWTLRRPDVESEWLAL